MLSIESIGFNFQYRNFSIGNICRTFSFHRNIYVARSPFIESEYSRRIRRYKHRIRYYRSKWFRGIHAYREAWFAIDAVAFILSRERIHSIKFAMRAKDGQTITWSWRVGLASLTESIIPYPNHQSLLRSCLFNMHASIVCG